MVTAVRVEVKRPGHGGKTAEKICHGVFLAYTGEVPAMSRTDVLLLAR
jgi:hypothetical protein